MRRVVERNRPHNLARQLFTHVSSRAGRSLIHRHRKWSHPRVLKRRNDAEVDHGGRQGRHLPRPRLVGGGLSPGPTMTETSALAPAMRSTR